MSAWPCSQDGDFERRIGGEEWLPAFSSVDARYIASCMEEKGVIDAEELYQKLVSAGLIVQEVDLASWSLSLEDNKVSRRWRVRFNPCADEGRWYALHGQFAADWYADARECLSHVDAKQRKKAQQKFAALQMAFAFETYSFVKYLERKVAFFLTVHSCMKVSARLIDFHAVAARWKEHCAEHPVESAPDMPVLDLVEAQVEGRRTKRVTLVPGSERAQQRTARPFSSVNVCGPDLLCEKTAALLEDVRFPYLKGAANVGRSTACTTEKSTTEGSPVCSVENLDRLSFQDGCSIPDAASCRSNGAPTAVFPTVVHVPLEKLTTLGLVINL